VELFRKRETGGNGVNDTSTPPFSIPDSSILFYFFQDELQKEKCGSMIVPVLGVSN